MDNGASSYRRYLAGDDDGLVELIRDYGEGLTLYLCGVVGSFSDAEELMEEVFFRLAAKKPRFHGKSSFKTWLYAIGRNLALDLLRKRKHLSDAPLEDYGSLHDEEADLEVAYLKEERRILVHRAMRRLSPDYGQVLYLIYFEGLSNAEAATVMHKSKRQIENLASRARKALKEALRLEGYLDEIL